MKHIKTFESFLNNEDLNEQYKVVLGDGKLTPIKKGDSLRFTDAAKEKGALGKLLQPYLDDTVEFDSMAGGALRIKIDGDTFIVDPSRFIKESEEMNEGAGDTIARDYEAILLSDVDPDDIYLSDNGIQWLDATAKSFGDNKKVYMTNKSHVEYHGKDWKTLLLLLKSKGVRYHTYDDDKDSFVLFSR